MLIAILPIYNESAALPSLLDRFIALQPDWGIPMTILAVDDGSADGSWGVLEEYRDRHPCVAPLRHQENAGLGAAVRTGIAQALRIGSAGDLILIMDADDTHDPSYVTAMLAEIAGGADVAIASRFESGGREVGVPWYRRAISGAGGRVLRGFMGIPGVRDYTCAFRIYRWELLRHVQRRWEGDLPSEKGFSCMVELLAKCHLAGADIREIPFVLRYDRKAGASKMAVGRTMLRTVLVVLGLRWQARRQERNVQDS